MNPLQSAVRRAALVALAFTAAAIATGPFASGPESTDWAAPGWTGLFGAGTVLRTALLATLLALLLPRLAGAAGRPERIAIGLGLWLLGVLLRYDAPIGDFQMLAWCAETWQPLGKWYGAAWLAGLWHQLLGAPLAISAERSVAILSAGCGALQICAAARVAVLLELPARWPAWRWVVIGSSGLILIGLGHREIYSLVALATTLVVLTGLRWIEQPSHSRALGFGLVVGSALTLYVGGLLVLPAFLWCLVRTPRQRAGWIAAALAATTACALPVLFLALGPETARSPLGATWGSQFGRGAALNLRAFPPFLPADVHWSWFTNLIAPAYWFSGWHLRDLLGVIGTAQPIGLALAGVLAVNRATWRDAAANRRAALIAWLVLPQLAYAALVVHGMPYPWDWDLPAHALASTTWLALALLSSAPSTAPPSRNLLLPVAAVFALAAGCALFQAASAPPPSFGSAERGLALAAWPERLNGAGGGFVWIWLHNTSGRALALPTSEFRIALVAERGSERLRSDMTRQKLLAGRRIEPGERVAIASFYFRPERFEALDLAVDPSGTLWRPIESDPLPGSYRARWLASLPIEPGAPPHQLVSAPFDWRIATLIRSAR